MFTLKAALMWKISDLPGLGTLSGWNTYTGLACPTCKFETDSCRLKNGRKWCFMGHRRFLKKDHKFRLNRSRFNGKVEEREPPSTLSVLDILNQLKNIDVTLGKEPKSNDKGKKTRGKKPVEEGKKPVEEGERPIRKRKRPVGKKKQRPVEEEEKPTIEDIKKQWRKKSIFFYLPYWESNLLRHNLDPMHIEKNVCDNVVYTLLNDSGKSKDNLNARKDLKKMRIRKDLWHDDNEKFRPSIFTMSNSKKVVFLQTLKNTTVPDGRKFAII